MEPVLKGRMQRTEEDECAEDCRQTEGDWLLLIAAF